MRDLIHNQPSQVRIPRIGISSLGDLIGSYNSADYWNALIENLDTPHYTSSELDTFDPLDSPSLENKPRGLGGCIRLSEGVYFSIPELDIFDSLNFPSLESKPKSEEDIRFWGWQKRSMPEPDIFDPLDYQTFDSKPKGIWEGIRPWKRKSTSVPEPDIFDPLDYQTFDSKPRDIGGVIGPSYLEERQYYCKNGFLLFNIMRDNLKAWLDELLYMTVAQCNGRVTKPP